MQEEQKNQPQSGQMNPEPLDEQTTPQQEPQQPPPQQPSPQQPPPQQPSPPQQKSPKQQQQTSQQPSTVPEKELTEPDIETKKPFLSFIIFLLITLIIGIGFYYSYRILTNPESTVTKTRKKAITEEIEQTRQENIIEPETQEEETPEQKLPQKISR
ncbi:hypothetical protein GF366_05040 [Candidatus Peregrinibacteria bacterium]|nr:hypothetical protein [Candidatus Peregrinibacteria bacterium]